MAREFQCRTCGSVVRADDAGLTPHAPFCSERCRMADLDRWFTEDYRIPGSREPGIDEA